MNTPAKVLIAKVGLDGHDRGAKIIARMLRDAGMEVVYTGLRRTVEEVVQTAAEEDVQFVGMSFLAGDHLTLVPRVIEGLRQHGLEDVRIVVGGIILQHQREELQRMGVHRVFFPGTPLDEIIAYFRDNAPAR